MKSLLIITLKVLLSAAFLTGYTQEMQKKDLPKETQNDGQEGKQAEQLKEDQAVHKERAEENPLLRKGKTAEIEIQTSAVCDMCKSRIEHDLAYAKGIRFVVLDPETKIVKVKYNTGKTDPDKIRLAISEIGYDADDVKADQRAHDKLPACCQKGVDPH